MHDMDGPLTRQYGVLGRMAAGVQTTEESPGSTEQGARRKPGKRGNALTVPRKRAGGQPPESNRNVPDASAGRMKRAILPAAISDPVVRSRCRLLTVARRDRKSRAAAKVTTRPVPVYRGGERWPSARQRVNRTRLTRLTLLMQPHAVVPLAQSAERRPVEPDVTGSSPVRHPISILYRVRALVAQLDRASDFGSEGWGFESLRAYHSLVLTLYGLSLPHTLTKSPLLAYCIRKSDAILQ